MYAKVSGSFPVMGFRINSAQPSVSATTELIS
jgi:hypothetical protein